MNEIEEIKSRLNIVDVVGSYVKLEKAGINYRACCPFHSEKTPSFFVSPARQIWHCFGGCNEGGDIFKFIMKIENIEFGDALRLLASRAGVELKSQAGDWQKTKSERQVLLNICEMATRFFEAYFKKSIKGKEAREYLLSRGLKQETIDEWRLGYAPESWSYLSDFLIGRGYKREDIVRAGLAIAKENNKFFDRFRSRIMFPIRGFSGEVTGFTGRIFGKDDEKEAKYLNTPNTLLYDKSRALFGIDQAKLEIRKNDFCILVEGNVDCIMSHQAGFKNCLAVSGTALTSEHLNIIKRYSPNLVLAFDMDLAGNKATQKGIALAQKMDFNIKVIPLTNEKDPADIILHEGEAKWKQMIESSEPANDFYFALALKNRNIDLIEDKKKIIADLLPVFKKISNTVEQSHWLNKLSATIRVEEADLRQEMEKVKEDSDTYEPKTINPACSNPIVRTKQDLLEEQAIFFVLLDRSNASLLSLETVNNFSSPSREILLKIIENPEITNDELINALKDSQPAVDLLNYLILKSEVESEIDDLRLELEKCVAERHNLINKNNRRELSLKIKECEAKGDFETLQKLLEEFNSLTIINKKNNENQTQEKESAPVEESQAKEPAQNQEEQKASSKEIAEEIKEEQTSSESQG
ncbi:MAG: DNA primase [Candidatus Paceibacterota bacterium]